MNSASFEMDVRDFKLLLQADFKMLLLEKFHIHTFLFL